MFSYPVFIIMTFCLPNILSTVQSSIAHYAANYGFTSHVESVVDEMHQATVHGFDTTKSFCMA